MPPHELQRLAPEVRALALSRGDDAEHEGGRVAILGAQSYPQRPAARSPQRGRESLREQSVWWSLQRGHNTRGSRGIEDVVTGLGGARGARRQMTGQERHRFPRERAAYRRAPSRADRTGVLLGSPSWRSDAGQAPTGVFRV